MAPASARNVKDTLVGLGQKIDAHPVGFRLLRGNPVADAFQRRKLHRWEDAGRPFPRPGAYRHATLIDAGRRFGLGTLVETGTGGGATPYACRKAFSRIYTVELEPEVAARARKIFARDPHVTVLQGDSGVRITEILATLTEPALFWLDAHYSGPGTAQAEIDTPIERELKAVLDHEVREHVILIDDARMFGSVKDYPSVAHLERLIGDRRPDWDFAVEGDIIRAHRHMPAS